MAKTEFEQMRDKALEQLMKGHSLTGKDGVFAPLLQQFLKSALESEMNAHLSVSTPFLRQPNLEYFFLLAAYLGFPLIA